MIAIYLADAKQLSSLYLYRLHHNLESYFALIRMGGSNEKEKFMARIKQAKKEKNDICLFLDSGAYSAFTKGIKIDIYEYIDFIKKYHDKIEIYANLDVIGDAEATFENQKIMEKEGLNPLPCFHYGEDIKYLIRYIKDYDYIALGGMVPISSKDLSYWLDNLFSSYIPAETKIHGFGLTSLKLMLRYPWYSVDSTSWVMTSRMGGVYVPICRDGKYIYNENSLKISVSSKSPDKKDEGKHIDTFSPNQKKIILDYFESKGYKLGKSEFDEDGKETIIEQGLSNNYKLRDELNIIFFLDLEKNMPEWPWKFEKKHLGFDL